MLKQTLINRIKMSKKIEIKPKILCDSENSLSKRKYEKNNAPKEEGIK